MTTLNSWYFMACPAVPIFWWEQETPGTCILLIWPAELRSAVMEHEDPDVAKTNQCASIMTKVLPISHLARRKPVRIKEVTRENQFLWTWCFTLFLKNRRVMRLKCLRAGVLRDIWTIVRIIISTRDASGDHYEPRGHFFMDVEDRAIWRIMKKKQVVQGEQLPDFFWYIIWAYI